MTRKSANMCMLFELELNPSPRQNTRLNSKFWCFTLLSLFIFRRYLFEFCVKCIIFNVIILAIDRFIEIYTNSCSKNCPVGCGMTAKLKICNFICESGTTLFGAHWPTYLHVCFDTTSKPC